MESTLYGSNARMLTFPLLCGDPESLRTFHILSAQVKYIGKRAAVVRLEAAMMHLRGQGHPHRVREAWFHKLLSLVLVRCIR